MTNAPARHATQIQQRFEPVSIKGSVRSVSGLGVVIEDRLAALKIGDRVAIHRQEGPLLAEIVGFGEDGALALPFGPNAGIARGATVDFIRNEGVVSPSDGWLGRIVNGLGNPVDGKGALPVGLVRRPLRASPPNPAERARLGDPIDFGVAALNCFTPTRRGQRMGVFSAAGIGKSALLGMIARHADCDVAVIALIGERGREVREFVEDHLGTDGLKQSVIVVATADEPAMMRREAAYLAMTLAESFRDQGAHVMCLMDSLTRVAQAQREIGLAAGEPPTAKGYTPSVFSLLPALIERAGPGVDAPHMGAISAVFSVLVEGDDHDEPIADAARAALDGHIVLDRRIAESGRMPAVDILRSISRAANGAISEAEAVCMRRVKALAASYEDMRDLIRIGAYRAGSDPQVDQAIAIHDELEEFLRQSVEKRVCATDAFDRLQAILNERDHP